MDNEKRKDHRQTLKYPARLDVGGEAQIQCLLTDVSATGARLIVEFPDKVPEHCALLLAPEHLVQRQCKVVWRDGNQIGVEFIKPDPAKAAARSQHIPKAPPPGA